MSDTSHTNARIHKTLTNEEYDALSDGGYCRACGLSMSWNEHLACRPPQSKTSRLTQLGGRLECAECHEVEMWCQCEPSPFQRTVPTPEMVEAGCSAGWCVGEGRVSVKQVIAIYRAMRVLDPIMMERAMPDDTSNTTGADLGPHARRLREIADRLSSRGDIPDSILKDLREAAEGMEKHAKR